MLVNSSSGISDLRVENAKHGPFDYRTLLCCLSLTDCKVRKEVKETTDSIIFLPLLNLCWVSLILSLYLHATNIVPLSTNLTL